jgi:hypothetical protein
MKRSTNDPVSSNVDRKRREEAQEVFGRHIVEQRNRMAVRVRRWIETEERFPLPIYDHLLDRVRKMDPAVRADVASIALLMADQIVSAVLTAFDGGDEMIADGQFVNYAVVAQMREPGSDKVLSEVDVNRGDPIIAVWNAYSKWLSRYAPTELRAVSARAKADSAEDRDACSE